eukprot:scaffold1397_cov254-Pinguiococcus_pyrenoidosus.AAC.31
MQGFPQRQHDHRHGEHEGDAHLPVHHQAPKEVPAVEARPLFRVARVQRQQRHVEDAAQKERQSDHLHDQEQADLEDCGPPSENSGDRSEQADSRVLRNGKRILRRVPHGQAGQARDRQGHHSVYQEDA